MGLVEFTLVAIIYLTILGMTLWYIYTFITCILAPMVLCIFSKSRRESERKVEQLLEGTPYRRQYDLKITWLYFIISIVVVICLLNRLCKTFTN